MKTNLDEFLTPKQQTFCNEYLIDHNATRAALRAGYSASTALNGQLMNMRKIKLYLQQKSTEAAQRVQVSHDMVLRELCKIAFGNMANYFATDGSIKPANQLSDDDKAALWSVSVTDAGSGAEAGITKFRLYNKLSALDKIAKHIDFYKPQNQEAETIYKFVTPAHITEDDTFDDPILQKELRDIENNEFEKAEHERMKAEREEALKNESQTDDLIDEDHTDTVITNNDACVYDEAPEEVLVADEDIIVDNGTAGVDEDINRYKIDLNESPAQLMARLKMEGGKPVEEDALPECRSSIPPIGLRLRQQREERYARMAAKGMRVF